MFRFKRPTDKSLEIMSETVKGNSDKNYEESCISKICSLTGKEHVKMTSSGNNSIFVALAATEGDVIIPDQGAWHGFRQIAKFLGKNILTLKTDDGLINTDYLDEININDSSALIFTSFAGYTAEQDTKTINKYCKDKGITTIEDASAGIGDEKLGRYSDIILASTGSPKMINVGSGGFIATDNEEIFKSTALPQKLSKTTEVTCSGIDNELNNVKKNLQLSLNATSYVKKHIADVIHQDKRGLNVIIPHSDAKSICWQLKKILTTDRSSMITACPNYNRIKRKAICVEIKNLDYTCLKKENMDRIIDEVNSQL